MSEIGLFVSGFGAGRIAGSTIWITIIHRRYKLDAIKRGFAESDAKTGERKVRKAQQIASGIIVGALIGAFVTVVILALEYFVAELLWRLP